MRATLSRCFSFRTTALCKIVGLPQQTTFSSTFKLFTIVREMIIIELVWRSILLKTKVYYTGLKHSKMNV